jgi:hypothetical protein
MMIFSVFLPSVRMAQFRKLLSENQRLNRFPWKFAGKTLLSLFFLLVLVRALFKNEQSLGDVWEATRTHVQTGKGIWLLTLVALVPVNWALESWKWQLLVNKIQRISFGEAVVSTLAGLLSGLALPAQVGDVVGRVAALQVVGRARTIGAAILSGGIQFYSAIFVGLASVYVLWDKLGVGASSLWLLTGVLWLVAGLGIALFLFRASLLAKLPTKGFLKKVAESLDVISAYGNTELLGAFGVGLLRYFTYLAQFVAGVLLFEFELSVLHAVSCVALILMVKTVLPALNLLGDLGLRGVSAVLVFGQFGILPGEVIAVTLLIWLTNILFPAFVGMILLWTGSFKRL